MTKTAKQIAIILIILIVAVAIFGTFTWIEKSKLEKDNFSLQQDLNKSQEFTKQQGQEIINAKNQLQKLNAEKQGVQEKLNVAEAKATELQAKIEEVAIDRDKWQRRIENVSKERDDLMAKVKELTDRQQQMDQMQTAEAVPQQDQQFSTTFPSDTTMPIPGLEGNSSTNEAYWASVLKNKAELEVTVESLKDELSKKEIEMVNLKEETSGLKIELDALKHAKEELAREIEHKDSLVNNISLELARSKNDKKFVADRAAKLNAENQELRAQMKQLVVTKSALEKSIVRLTDDKNQVEKKLGQSETIIQSKIDEIWEIKDSIDESFKTTKITSSSNEVELPPIVVSSSGASSQYTVGSNPGFNGKVVSINESNNFIIVDIGENQGIRLGDALSVYRDSKYIARLEVIQIRKDISAADIKDQWAKIKVGDIVK